MGTKKSSCIATTALAIIFHQFQETKTVPTSIGEGTKVWYEEILNAIDFRNPDMASFGRALLAVIYP